MEGLPNAFDEHSLQIGTNFTLEVENENLDLLAEMSGIGGYDQVVPYAEVMEVGGRSIRVLALPQLIQTKQAAGRPKDLAMLPILEATLREKHTPPQ
jgi:hypothetical protein